MGLEPVPGEPPGAPPGRDVAEAEAGELVEEAEGRGEVRAVLLPHHHGLRHHPERPRRARRVARVDVAREGRAAGERGLAVAPVPRHLPRRQVPETELADLVRLDHAVAVASPEPRPGVVLLGVAEIVGAAVAHGTVVRAGVGHRGPGPRRVCRRRAVGELVVESPPDEADDAPVPGEGVVSGGTLHETRVDARRVVGPRRPVKRLLVEAAVGEPRREAVLLDREAGQELLPGQADDRGVRLVLRLDPRQQLPAAVEDHGMVRQGRAPLGRGRLRVASDDEARGGEDEHDAGRHRPASRFAHQSPPTRRSRYWPYSSLRIRSPRRRTSSAVR
jgi:hypothetical protein